MLARGLATYVYATCNRKSRAITCPALPLVALVCKIFAKSCTVCRAGGTCPDRLFKRASILACCFTWLLLKIVVVMSLLNWNDE